MRAQGTQTAAVVLSSATQELALQTQMPSPSPTIALPPTITLTPAPPAPIVSVSINTHCRTDPGTSYDSRGVLFVDETAKVLAQSTVANYWYIVNPDKLGEDCWLWGEYTEVVGDTDALPVFTPLPSPTPNVVLDLTLYGFEYCGSITYVVFAVQNKGSQILKSGYVAVYDLDAQDQLYGPARERHPFAERPRPVCPPGHGNILTPGEVEYIHAPIDPVPHGSRAS